MVILNLSAEDIEKWLDFDLMTGKYTPKENAPKRVIEELAEYEKTRAEERENHKL